MIINVLIPVILMTSLGLVFGLGLAYVLKIFGIQVDPTVALILTKLPGANCGVCGKAGCSGFAEALKKGEVVPASCVVSNEEARRSISEILGIEYNPKVKNIAVVLCNGGTDAKDKYVFRGIRNCAAASLVFGGHKECSFGCLGFGDCKEACPFDAIRMAENDIPRIDPQKCTGCGNCVKACPKKIITLMPYNVKEFAIPACCSHDKAARVKKLCTVGCIACGICEKLSEGVFKVEDNLSVLHPELIRDDIDWDEIIKKCPTHTIVRIK